MSSDLLLVLGCGILGLLSHAAIKKRWLEWVLRVAMGLTFGGEAAYLVGLSPTERLQHWNYGVTYVACSFSGFLLVNRFRRILSACLTAVDLLFSKQAWLALFKGGSHLKAAFIGEKIFVPTSIPHMVALYIYVQTMAFLLSAMDPIDFKFPGMPLPLPVQLEALFSYNGLGLIMLSFCGVGIFVSRPFKEVLIRLGLVKPTKVQVAIGLAMVAVTFTYDYVWSLFAGGGMPNMLSNYNAGTFSVIGGFMPSVVLALFTGLCAGIGEETLVRGALQPVFGIVPAAILHGVLHGQFGHAPLFIVQVAGWSILMGIVRRYTNTTTTAIGHGVFNFITTFLFAFNPK